MADNNGVKVTKGKTGVYVKGSKTFTTLNIKNVSDDVPTIDQEQIKGSISTLSKQMDELNGYYDKLKKIFVQFRDDKQTKGTVQRSLTKMVNRCARHLKDNRKLSQGLTDSIDKSQQELINAFKSENLGDALDKSVPSPEIQRVINQNGPGGTNPSTDTNTTTETPTTSTPTEMGNGTGTSASEW